MQKVFLLFVFLFFWPFGFFSLFLFFLEKVQKRQFPSSFGVIVPCCSPKGLSLKSFFSSYSVFFLVFLLSSLSNSIPCLCFLSINLFLKVFFGGVLLSVFCCLFLSSCLLVSLKQTFLTSPFWNPSCFRFLVVSFFLLLLFLFLFSWCMFLPFCFFRLALFLVCLLLFLFYFLFRFQTMKSIVSLQFECF